MLEAAEMMIPLANAAIDRNSAFASGGLVTAVESEVQGLMSSNIAGVYGCVCVFVLRMSIGVVGLTNMRNIQHFWKLSQDK